MLGKRDQQDPHTSDTENPRPAPSSGPNKCESCHCRHIYYNSHVRYVLQLQPLNVQFGAEEALSCLPCLHNYCWILLVATYSVPRAKSSALFVFRFNDANWAANRPHRVSGVFGKVAQPGHTITACWANQRPGYRI
jgi:hypothetical protein